MTVGLYNYMRHQTALEINESGDSLHILADGPGGPRYINALLRCCLFFLIRNSLTDARRPCGHTRDLR